MKLLEAGTEEAEASPGLEALETAPPGTPVHVRVGANVEISRLLERLADISAVTVVFGAFRDGRGFSVAARLRGSGFAGRLVASGDLLPDQALFLARCGFDAVELPPGAERNEWEAGLSVFSAAYQPAAAAGPTVWALRAERRRASNRGADQVGALNARFRRAPAETLLEAAIQEIFAGRIALLSSFGAEAAVTLHLVSRIAPSTPVLFLDTDRHFAPTLQYRDLLVRRLGLTEARVLAPEDAETADPDGQLWARDPEACCDLRKVQPLAKATAAFDALITGRKRMHGGQRTSLPPFELRDGVIRVNPLAGWAFAEVEAYFRAHDLPRHPLVQAGYTSIGCWPCTEPTRGRGGDRSGRWSGRAKQECGIHLGFNRGPGRVQPLRSTG